MEGRLFKKKIIAIKTETEIDKLPEYIFPVYHPETKNKIGYYVEGMLDNNGNPYPTKYFTDLQTNRWNLFQAKQYILKCDIKNKDEIFQTPPDFQPSRRRKYHEEDDNNLPKYVSILRQNGIKIGYNIAIPSIIKSNGKRYTKKFADKKLSMEEKLHNCIETLEKIKQEYNVTN